MKSCNPSAVFWMLPVFFLVATAQTVPSDPQINSTEARIKCAEGSNQFSFDFYNVLQASRANENMIFSAFSLRTVMAMLLAGAEGLTASEIRKAMVFPENNAELFEGYRSLLRTTELIKSDHKKNNPTYPVILEQANRIFIKREYPVTENFQATAKHFFQSPILQMDFANSKKAATEINHWVADKTHQKIQKLIDYDVLNNYTRMVIVNTLYFKGPWEHKFQGRSTQKKPFHMSKDRTASVDMMQTENYFSVSSHALLNARAIAIPYENKRFQLVILLPNQRYGLEDLEKRLSQTQFSRLQPELMKAKTKNILLSLPKFKIESSYDLIDTLKQMNVKEMFDENQADFSSIVKPEFDRLYVSKILQKAFLTVEEQGSEAGAATYGAIFSPLSIGPAIEEEIVVDHPFIGYIYDTASQAILFMFRVTKF